MIPKPIQYVKSDNKTSEVVVVRKRERGDETSDHVRTYAPTRASHVRLWSILERIPCNVSGTDILLGMTFFRFYPVRASNGELLLDLKIFAQDQHAES